MYEDYSFTYAKYLDRNLAKLKALEVYQFHFINGILRLVCFQVVSPHTRAHFESLWSTLLTALNNRELKWVYFLAN